MKISDQELQNISKYIHTISGIHLDQSKAYLVETRLKPLMTKTASSSYDEFISIVQKDRSQNLKSLLIDAISTNETYFFRDNVPFELLKNKIIPDLIDLRRKSNSNRGIPIRIWSAASSTGQEVYSIAMTLEEMLRGMGNFDIHILGTDISNEAVAYASYGKYSQFEVQRGLPENYRSKYFTPVGNGWRVKDEIRSMVKFEKINLLKPFSNSLGPFDIVFCRNVAIYFKPNDKLRLFRQISRIINYGGCLIVGGSESLSGIAPDFKNQQYLRGNYYTLRSNDGAEAQSDKDISVATPLSSSPPQVERRKSIYDRPQQMKSQFAGGNSTKKSKENSLLQGKSGSLESSKIKEKYSLDPLKQRSSSSDESPSGDDVRVNENKSITLKSQEEKDRTDKAVSEKKSSKAIDTLSLVDPPPSKSDYQGEESEIDQDKSQHFGASPTPNKSLLSSFSRPTSGESFLSKKRGSHGKSWLESLNKKAKKKD